MSDKFIETNGSLPFLEIWNIARVSAEKVIERRRFYLFVRAASNIKTTQYDNEYDNDKKEASGPSVQQYVFSPQTA